MKVRFKQWVTTIIGTLIMLSGVIAIFLGIFNIITPINIWTIVVVEFLGWVFVAAKDSILEGITLNILKLKK